MTRYHKISYCPGNNLPFRIMHPQGRIVNHYTLGGAKLGKMLFDRHGNLTCHEQYYGDLVIKDGQPTRILHGDGTISLNGSSVEYHYHLKDHLGNVRLVITPDGNNQPHVLQANDYYPFGMAYTKNFPSYGNVHLPNKYLYNSKEEQEMPGKFLDYGWRMYDPQLGRWHGVDLHAENYFSWSPYNYVLGNPIRSIDPDGRDVYILFYTVGNNRGDRMFQAAAQTRKEEIEAQKGFNSETDKVIMFGVSDISDVGSLTEWAVGTFSEQFGQTAEVGVWSHAGMDGPVGTENASNFPLSEGSNQMSMEGWGSINFNWTGNGANMSFYGCNTGRDVTNAGWVGSFARNVSNLSNMRDVNIWGQASSSYPSDNPYYRQTSLTRSMGAFSVPTYLVGGNAGEGRQSLWFNRSSDRPIANPMNVYRRGRLVRTAYQNR